MTLNLTIMSKKKRDKRTICEHLKLTTAAYGLVKKAKIPNYSKQSEIEICGICFKLT